MAATGIHKKKGNVRRRNKRHGFLKRMRTPGGRAVIRRRRSRGRHVLAV